MFFLWKYFFTHLFWWKKQFPLIWSVFVMWIDKNVDFDMLFIDDARPFLMFFLLVHNWLSVIFLHFHIPFFIFWFLLHMFFRSSLFLPARWLRQRKFQLFFLPLSFMNFRLRFLCLPVCVHLHSHSKAVKILGIFFLCTFWPKLINWLGLFRLAWLCTFHMLSKDFIVQFAFYNQLSRSFIALNV